MKDEIVIDRCPMCDALVPSQFQPNYATWNVLCPNCGLWCAGSKRKGFLFAADGLDDQAYTEEEIKRLAKLRSFE